MPGPGGRTGATDPGIDWIPAGPETEFGIAVLLLGSLLPAGTIGLMVLLVPGVLSNLYVDGVFVVLVCITLTTSVLTYLMVGMPRSVGLRSQGVTLRFVGREVDLPWTSLSPDLLTYESWGLRLRYVRPGATEPSRTVLSPPQARALLQHPSAPRWVGPNDVLVRWGIAPKGSDPTGPR